MDLGSSGVVESSCKARHGVFGAVESVSPLSIVSCRTGDSNPKSNAALDSGPPTSLRGFLVQFMVCECRSCSSKESVMVLRDLIQEKDAHSFTKPVFVYCCGSASSWHPVFTKLVGNIVALSGLKKKLVYIGKEESKVMCVTTGNSALHLSRLSRKWTPKVKVVRKGNGEVGTYRGIVRGVYMQGMLVEKIRTTDLWIVSYSFTITEFVEMYAVSQMPLSMHQSRPGVFMEFCKHDSCGCGCEPYIDNLTLVHQAVI
ncbi:hypothetical protein ACLB2K_045346 [Fragaria x ananassa]